MDRSDAFDRIPLHIRKEAYRLCFGKHEARWPIDEGRLQRLLEDEVSWKTLVLKKRKKGWCHVTTTWFDYYCFLVRSEERVAVHRVDLPPPIKTTKSSSAKQSVKNAARSPKARSSILPPSTVSPVVPPVDLSRPLSDEHVKSLGKYCGTVLGKSTGTGGRGPKRPKEDGPKPGDVVVVRDGFKNERLFLLTDGDRKTAVVPFDASLDAGGTLPSSTGRAIERFPIVYWKDAVKHNGFVWCDLAGYLDEIWDNLKRFAVPEKTSRKKEGATVYVTHFVYRNDFAGLDNRYDLVVLYDLSRDFVLDREELSSILKRGLFEHSDRTRLHQGTSDDVNPHNTLYYVY